MPRPRRLGPVGFLAMTALSSAACSSSGGDGAEAGTPSTASASDAAAATTGAATTSPGVGGAGSASVSSQDTVGSTTGTGDAAATTTSSGVGGASSSGAASGADDTTSAGGSQQSDASTSVGGTGSSDATSAVGSGGTGTETTTGGAGVDTTTTGNGGTGGVASGCPTTLEGFATLNAMGQDGTYGGRDGQTVTVTTQAELDQYATASEPYVIRVQGAVTISPKGTEIRVASNKTIVGVGASGEIVEGGFFLAEGVHNVIIRNLTVRDTYVEGDWEGKTQDFDGVQMDTAHHVWIDHCHFHHLGDGIIDSRKDTTYLTVSWNILSDHNKAFGIGWTDNVTAEMTIHHNWFRDLNQRNPSIDNVLRAHLYNNFLQRIDSYGNYARGATNLILENSVFDTVNDPHYGDTGSLVATGNIYRNTTGQQETYGSAFFDPSDYYSYTLDPADQVEQLLADCAGPRPELGQ